jgi:hypothetical protein
VSERKAKLARSGGIEKPARSNRSVIFEHFLDTLVVLGCEVLLYACMGWAQGFFSIPEDAFRYPRMALRWFATATVGWFAVESFARIVWKGLREMAGARL